MSCSNSSADIRHAINSVCRDALKPTVSHTFPRVFTLNKLQNKQSTIQKIMSILSLEFPKVNFPPP